MVHAPLKRVVRPQFPLPLFRPGRVSSLILLWCGLPHHRAKAKRPVCHRLKPLHTRTKLPSWQLETHRSAGLHSCTPQNQRRPSRHCLVAPAAALCPSCTPPLQMDPSRPFEKSCPVRVANQRRARLARESCHFSWQSNPCWLYSEDLNAVPRVRLRA